MKVATSDGAVIMIACERDGCDGIARYRVLRNGRGCVELCLDHAVEVVREDPIWRALVESGGQDAS